MSKSPHPIAAALVTWFEKNGRDYPWRRTEDPWAILVSEVMLQQTTISTILARYEKWMAQYPSPAALAAASEEEALRSWEGLGYYRRVRMLKASAEAIMERFDGIFPRAAEDIRALPGIGDYTLGAVLSFAYNQPAPIVDANVSRVFARIFNDSTPIDSTAGRKAQWAQAELLLHPSNPRAYNSSLMELGQSICSIKAPQCLICPIREYCQATNPENLPCKQAKTAATVITHWDIWSLHPEKGLLMQQQEKGKRHQGMYRLPSRSQEEVQSYTLLKTQKYSVTRYKVTRHLHQASPEQENAREEEQYIPINQLEGIPMASPDRKIVQQILFSAKKKK